MSPNLPVPALTGEVLDLPAPALPVPARLGWLDARSRHYRWLGVSE
jgi:hypothetical protein